MDTIWCFGDSNTYGFDPRSWLGGRYPESVRWTGLVAARAGCRVQNDGMNGREIPSSQREAAALAARLSGEGQAWLWIMLGTNDRLTCPAGGAARVAQKMECFLRWLAPLPPFCTGAVRVRVIAPPPFTAGTWVEDAALIEGSVRLGGLLRQSALRCGAAFTNAGSFGVPLLFDGVHFSEEGHRVFAEGMLEVLRREEPNGAGEGLLRQAGEGES